MAIIAAYDIVDETVTFPAPLPPPQAWRSAIATLATKARKALPDSHGRIDQAVKLLLNGDVELLPNGLARIASQSDPTKTYTLNGQGCPCPDAERAPHGLCKHRLAKSLYLKALELAKTLAEQGMTVSTTAEVPEEAPAGASASRGDDLDTPQDPAHPSHGEEAPVSILPQFLVEIQGKQFVTFHGLLALAHQHGLLSLKATFLSVTPELALAHAVATFRDGREFEECGDATPSNVNARIKPHFARMALTRAKARCLRDALNLAYVCAEELD
jgi:hypothetical protein